MLPGTVAQTKCGSLGNGRLPRGPQAAQDQQACRASRSATPVAGRFVGCAGRLYRRHPEIRLAEVSAGHALLRGMQSASREAQSAGISEARFPLFSADHASSPVIEVFHLALRRSRLGSRYANDHWPAHPPHGSRANRHSSSCWISASCHGRS